MSPGRLCLAVLAFLATLAPAAAADVIIEVDVGWGGRFRPDRWTPAVVRAQASQPTPTIFRWYVPRPGRESMVIEQSVTLNPQSGDHYAYLPIGPDPAAVHLTVSDARTGQTLAYWPTQPLSPIAYADVQVRQPIFIGVSGEGPALGGLDESQYSVSFLPPARLPRRAIGYDGLDLLALNQPQLVDLDLEQQHAIAAWVGGGGRLLLWLDMQAIPEDSPLLSLLPGTVEDFEARTIDGQEVIYTRLAGVSPEQLVTRRSAGLGEIVFLHIPPEAATVARVPFLPTEPRLDPVTTPDPPATAAAAAGEAARAVKRFPVSLLVVAILIGPIDWLVLHRTRRRMRRWWITLPGWLAVFGLLIWYLPTRPTPVTATAVATEAGSPEALVKGVVATTSNRLEGEEGEEIARLRSTGPVFWRTLGFARTQGPLREVVFQQGDDGMTAEPRQPLVAEGTAFPN